MFPKQLTTDINFNKLLMHTQICFNKLLSSDAHSNLLLSKEVTVMAGVQAL